MKTKKQLTVKKKIKYHSTAEERQKSNPYAPMSYREYCDTVLIMAYELNEMIQGVPESMIPDFWMITPNFRARFKRMARAVAFIHYEEKIQPLIPWCPVNLLEYCKRFQSPLYSIEKKYSPCTLDGKK